MGANRTFFIFISIQLMSLMTAQEINKRVPQGFLGMRGKKQLDDEGFEQFYKRKPQFFVGVKGKKNLQDMLDNREEYYRNARAFQMALNGKKDSFAESESSEYVPKRDGSWIGQIDYSTSGDTNNYLDNYPILNELLMQYLQKLDRSSITNIDPDLTAETEGDSMSNEIAKRAANIHQFFGVRGKKSLNNKRPYDLSFRGKFIGVRGKKDLKNSGTHEIKFLLDSPLPKRKSQMGFFGMRGKKWSETDESSQEMETPN